MDVFESSKPFRMDLEVTWEDAGWGLKYQFQNLLFVTGFAIHVTFTVFPDTSPQ